MKKAAVAAVLLALVMSTSQAIAGKAVPIVQDGQAQAVIIVSDSAIPSEKWAALELRDHVKQMTGAELNIVADGAAADKPTRIYIGLDAVKGVDSSASIEKLGYDGFIIDAKGGAAGGAILIYGTKPRGAMYGVYTLIEAQGVRWWTPTVTYIPKTDTIAVNAGRIEETPRLEYRDMMYMESFDAAGKLWFARNKLNGMTWDDKTPDLLTKIGGRYKFHGNLVHSYKTLLRDSGVKVEPAMWAQVGGKPNEGQPCLTNPKVLEVISNQVIKVYKNDPTLKFVVVGQDDNHSYCRCERCQKLIDAEGQSGPVIKFANEVAERVEKEVPGAIITTAAYEWSRKPPKTLRPRHNVYITLCSIECDFGHPLATARTKVNTDFRTDIQAWSKLTGKLLIWDYVTNYWRFIMPHPNLDVLVPNIKFFADMGAAGVFEQAAHRTRGSDFVQLRMWVMAKGLWNPEADNWALINEFIDGYYGPAAPAIKKYMEIIHKPIRDRPDYVLKIYLDMNGPYIAPDVMADAEVALRAAAAAVQGDAELEKRVRHACLGMQYVQLMRGVNSPAWRAVEAKVGKMSYSQVAEEFMAMVREQGIVEIAAGSPIAPWLTWLEDYAKQNEAGVPLPPELKGRDSSKYRLIQAGQMDRKNDWLTKAEGASDGWAFRCRTIAWLMRHTLSENVDFTPGKTYRLMIRVKGTPKPDATGPVITAGMHMATGKSVNNRITADKMTGDWQALEVLTWKPQHGDSYWVALQNPGNMNEVLQDCMWLELVD